MERKTKRAPDTVTGFAASLLSMHRKEENIIPVRMSVPIARALRNLMDDAVQNVPGCEHDAEDAECGCRDDYHAAIQWVRNQVHKRYSIADLCR